jgi:hypothetical protein
MPKRKTTRLRENASLKAVAEHTLRETRRAKGRWTHQQNQDACTLPAFREWARWSLVAQHLARLAKIETEDDWFASISR